MIDFEDKSDQKCAKLITESVTSEISYDFSLYHLKLIFENNIPFFLNTFVEELSLMINFTLNSFMNLKSIKSIKRLIFKNSKYKLFRFCYTLFSSRKSIFSSNFNVK